MDTVTIEVGDNLCERGNTWLSNDGSHIAWFDQGESSNGKRTWLEVSVCPGNYPGFNVRITVATEQEIRNHIHNRCSGWFVNRCNIPGVWTNNDEVTNRAWVFVDDETGEEVGEAEPVGTAMEQIQSFSREYGSHFSVFFRDTNGELNSCSAEDSAEDFD